jgi:hypothetical protein
MGLFICDQCREYIELFAFLCGFVVTSQQNISFSDNNGVMATTINVQFFGRASWTLFLSLLSGCHLIKTLCQTV